MQRTRKQRHPDSAPILSAEEIFALGRGEVLIASVATFLQITPASVQKLIRAKRLQSRTFGGSVVVVNVASVMTYAATRRSPRTPPIPTTLRTLQQELTERLLGPPGSPARHRGVRGVGDVHLETTNGVTYWHVIVYTTGGGRIRVPKKFTNAFQITTVPMGDRHPLPE